MKLNGLTRISITLVLLLSSVRAFASDDYSVQLYFGLSVPDGSGVSMQQWDTFMTEHIVTRFAGFNVVDSVGYWQGKPERSKIVTILLKASQVAEAEAVARQYAKQFHQDSVMMVKSSVVKVEFVSAKEPELIQ
ncbi:DUF3574 domain-containing protein [Motilimonas eburnea]|uniref:DUF3574 domain-containing protein n=1 Tax=Motilimonas eburnea TaxID=1737488 RepID=UPI001E488E57|nr:DUF3574 domain-containing protein [Motilimonas eburnea]MCE2573475.1 DUF3574 domain-containing protein [Motilimonas eburnea]